MLRFGNPNLAEDSTLEFAKVFSLQYSPIIIKEVLNVLALRPGVSVMSNTLEKVYFIFLSTCFLNA